MLAGDGSSIVRFRDPAAPATAAGTFYDELRWNWACTWHPSRDVLLVLRAHPETGVYDLMRWTAPE